MATRCTIAIKEGKQVFKIYRHWDGYPEGVLSDLKAALVLSERGLEDPEYFLANFIFLGKLGMSGWQLGYGVCGSKHEHGDLEYAYTLWLAKDKVTPMIEIQHRDVFTDEWSVEFRGTLWDAFVKYGIGKEGCHINEVAMERLRLILGGK